MLRQFNYLKSAIDQGNFKEAIRAFYSSYKKRDEKGRSILMYATINGHFKCVKFIMDNQSGKRMLTGLQDKDGFTAINLGYKKISNYLKIFIGNHYDFLSRKHINLLRALAVRSLIEDTVNDSETPPRTLTDRLSSIDTMVARVNEIKYRAMSEFFANSINKCKKIHNIVENSDDEESFDVLECPSSDSSEVGINDNDDMNAYSVPDMSEISMDVDNNINAPDIDFDLDNNIEAPDIYFDLENNIVAPDIDFDLENNIEAPDIDLDNIGYNDLDNFLNIYNDLLDFANGKRHTLTNKLSADYDRKTLLSIEKKIYRRYLCIVYIIKHMPAFGEYSEFGHKDNNKYTFLARLVHLCHIPLLKLTLSKLAKSISNKEIIHNELLLNDKNRPSTLIAAVIRNNKEAVKLLLNFEKTTKIQCTGGRDPSGMCTALMIAAKGDNQEIVKLLIPFEAGLKTPKCNDLSIRTNTDEHSPIGFNVGLCAASFAIMFNKNKNLALLLDKEFYCKSESGVTILMQAALLNNAEATKMILGYEIKKVTKLSNESNILRISGSQDSKGRTALMYAIINNYPLPAMLLLCFEAGKRDNNGKSALMYLTSQAHKKSIILVEKLMNYNLWEQELALQDNKGKTALMYALESRNIGYITRMLNILQDDYQEEIIDNTGKSSFDYAFLSNLPSVVKLFKKKLTNDRLLIYQKKYKFLENCLPYIKVGSFIDILLIANKKPTQNYEDVMEEMSSTLESHPIKLDKMEELLKDDIFCKNKEKLLSVITDMKQNVYYKELSCNVCLEEEKTLYRNCKNCMCYACEECWEACKNKCPQCNIKSVRWKRVINSNLLCKSYNS